MEAFGEDRADIAVGTDVSGLSAAASLRGRRLRSVPSEAPAAGSRSESPVKAASIKTDSEDGAAAGFRSDARASEGGAAAAIAVGSGPATQRPETDGPASVAETTTGLASPALATPDLKAALVLLDAATAAAAEELAAANFIQAADFAELIEKLSRRVEHLQVLAAGAVDRTRTEAIYAAQTTSKAPAWTTGWRTEPEPAPAPAASASASAVGWSPSDDGAHNTAEFLRTRLRISTPEARRRLALANATLPRTGLAGRPMPPERAETASALTAGIISSRAGTTITTALDKVRHIPNPALIAEMEHNLTQTAIENDHDFLTRIAHRWIDALDQDGTEPSEENLRHRQGVF
ncbi:DUF222 domain-containing protein, partial [Arthrobacter globiformis]|uniref:DUF222 domain-containing protein n=1 Tax=Arthrobacter globiformis TaxID=1665 RepID=UPI003978EFA7